MDLNRTCQENQENNNAWLDLTLSLSPPRPPPAPPSPRRITIQYIQNMNLFPPHPPRQPPHYEMPEPEPEPESESEPESEPEPESIPKSGTSSEEELVLETNSSSGKPRQRKQQLPILKEGKSYTINPPYPWATSKRATVPSLEHLLSQGITTINGTLQCKKCGAQREVEFDLKEKFYEVARFIVENMETMHQRAPEPWTKPVLPTCEGCGKEKSMKPVITKKRTINWLFLLLGQMLGCCTISQLKYFCKHTMNHKTGAKNRVLYLTYLGLCKQLDPGGPFHVSFDE